MFTNKLTAVRLGKKVGIKLKKYKADNKIFFDCNASYEKDVECHTRFIFCQIKTLLFLHLLSILDYVDSTTCQKNLVENGKQKKNQRVMTARKRKLR